MQYTIKVTEKTSATIQVSARSATEALNKAERLYYNDKIELAELAGVEFVADLGANKAVKTEVVE